MSCLRVNQIDYGTLKKVGFYEGGYNYEYFTEISLWVLTKGALCKE